MKAFFMTSKPTFFITVGVIWLALCQPTWANDPAEGLPRPGAAALQEPDYDSVAREAGEITPGAEYLESLPKRRADCTEASSPYSHSPITARMVEGMTIRLVCLEAMLHRLGNLYYGSEAFGPSGTEGQFDKLHTEVYEFLQDMYNGTPDCFASIEIARFCGFVNLNLSPRADYLDYLADLVEMMSLGTGRIRDVPAWRAAWAEAGTL